MREIRYFYSNGKVRDGNYDELTAMNRHGKKQWNQEALRRIAEPRRPFKIVCCCRNDNVEILMHIVEKPSGSSKYYLATNPKQSDMHEKECPKRRMEETVVVVPPSETESAIQHMDNGDGTTSVHIQINPFRGGIRERDEMDLLESEANTLTKTESPAVRVVDADPDGTARVRKQKAQAEFGGLIREWYLYGRQTALANKEPGKQFITRMNILYGMVVSMGNNEIFLSKGQNLKSIAFVPNKKIRYYSDGEHRILLGLYQDLQSTDNDEQVISIRGLNDTWNVVVPESLVDTVGKPSMRKLIAVRAIRKSKTWRLTHKPFSVLLADPDAMWVESGIEEDAYNILKEKGFRVDKPLRILDELGGLRPDFQIKGLNRRSLSRSMVA